jgi:fructan beta-fructosidase
LIKRTDGHYELSLSATRLRSFSITFSNDKGEKLVAGFDLSENAWFIDRTQAGESGFSKDFAKRISTPRIAQNSSSDLTLIIDAASVELFADKGLTTMTSIFFPQAPLDHISISSNDSFVADKVVYTPLKSIWP